jgi:hypothetical protein
VHEQWHELFECAKVVVEPQAQHTSVWCAGRVCFQVVEEEEEEQVLSWAGCFIWLAVVTVFISILSDYIMDAITG